ncbi:hypothetical protein BGW36DRAFT_382506 [Talaromyces proteolyticus]|uniref:Transcription factor TFIIIC complex subunit Tfc6 n=1 Tax=Talaromyces proteolyticus TaxID=1131652 RepID=A0AAD4KMI1_9EURO|nr:uncharacterized protein BGW36DRAFT_382506 [Talaromyces proteolyticus]KAH8695340.1 hypothetical protein BGW36DRAFT_382506 [Talaromyces proteolyticus]
MSTRRSSRRSGARKSYTDDPFQAIGLEESEDEEDIEQSIVYKGKGKAKKRKRDESDDEFDEYAANQAELNEEEDEDEIEEEDEGIQNHEDVQSRESGVEDIEEDQVQLATTPKSTFNRGSRYRDRKMDGTVRFQSQETHSRGVYNPSEHVSKSMHLKLTFGLDNRDLLALVSTRTRWSSGIDSTFPSRTTLDKELTSTTYGPGSTHGVYVADMEREATSAWDWYHSDNLGVRFKERQFVENIGEAEARQRFLCHPEKDTHKVIFGRGDELSTVYLHNCESFNFGDCWKNRDETHKTTHKETAKKKGPKKSLKREPTEDAVISETPTQGKRRKNRYGWILNLSGKIQALSWAPNQHGSTQYLAVSVPINSDQEKKYTSLAPPAISSAFSPSPPYPGAIQIWSFDAEEREEKITKTLDVERKPKLRLVLCMEFGHIRKINWCPIPRKSRNEDAHNLGLLACVFSDGRTRIFDVKISCDSEKTEYLYVKSAAFTAIPSPTISTCMAWLSPTDIVVACANGSVAVYNILTYDASQGDREPIPYIYAPIHSTYITNMDTAYPQHPHIISTVSMDGNTRLTSLIDPTKDMVDTQRQRMGTTHISYYPHLQAFVSSDENDFLRGLTVRRFYTTTLVGRLPSSISAIATGSRWHPSAMVGSTEGSVFVMNPLRRLMHAKEPHYHARWFLHEWAKSKDWHTPNTSRFTENIEVESLSLNRATHGDGKIVNGIMTITIYDEEQQVFCLEWNPNQSCAGWAAAGMGCGLLRVEDLAMFH